MKDKRKPPTITIEPKLVYFKRSRPGEPPVKYSATRVGRVVKVTVKLDPVLSLLSNKDLRDGFLVHELSELSDWALGIPRDVAHKRAMVKEPLVTRRLRTTRAFWEEIKRREQQRAKRR